MNSGIDKFIMVDVNYLQLSTFPHSIESRETDVSPFVGEPMDDPFRIRRSRSPGALMYTDEIILVPSLV